MRDAVAWCLRRARTWVALAAACVATLLASGDGKAGWTATVAAATFGLAALSMRAHFLDEHPDRPDPRQVRHDEMVAAILRRYHGVHEAPKTTRKERRAAERARRLEEDLASKLAALKQPYRPE